MDNVVERIGELLAKLQSPDFYERENAVKELGTYNKDEAVAGLIIALEDPDLGIREVAAEHLTKIKGATASQLLVRFLEHNDIGTRNLASEILVKIGREAVPALLEHINDDDYDVRKFIVDVLGLIKDEQAIEAVCQKLWDENNNVVCSAAEALGEIGSAEAVPHLIAVSEKVEDARLPAVEALGKIGDPSILPHLYKCLKTDDPMVEYAVLEAIGQIGVTDSIKELMPFLDSPDRSIAETAMMAVINISNRRGGRIDDDLPLDKFTDFLFDGIRNRNEDITDFTLNRLTHWYGNTIIESMLGVIDCVDEDRFRRISDILSDVGYPVGKMVVKKLVTTTSNSLRLKLLDVLKPVVTSDLAADILPFADDQDPEVRQRIAHLLGISGHSGAIQTLRKLVLDSNGHVRSAAYSALGWLCTEDDVDLIMTGLDDKYPDVREAAVGALIVIGGSKVIAKFNADLYHEDAERQRLAVTALGWIGERDVVDPLVRATNHPDAGVRKSAINSLARLGQLPDIEPITMALNDESSAVRKAAVSALVALVGERAVHDIRLLLDDEDVWVRYHTIGAIGALRKPEFTEYLLPCLEDDQDVVKLATAKAMAELGDRRAIPALNKLAQEKNADLVRAAKAALSTIGENK